MITRRPFIWTGMSVLALLIGCGRKSTLSAPHGPPATATAVTPAAPTPWGWDPAITSLPKPLPGSPPAGDAVLATEGVYAFTRSVPAPYGFVVYFDAEKRIRPDGTIHARGRVTYDRRTGQILEVRGDYADDEADQLDDRAGQIASADEAIDLATRHVNSFLPGYPNRASRREIDLVAGRYYVIYFPATAAAEAAARASGWRSPEYAEPWRVTVDGLTRKVIDAPAMRSDDGTGGGR